MTNNFKRSETIIKKESICVYIFKVPTTMYHNLIFKYPLSQYYSCLEIKILCQTIKENNGQYIVRTNKKPDIVIFVYGYFPNGYVIEFQIAHPFAI